MLTSEKSSVRENVATAYKNFLVFCYNKHTYEKKSFKKRE